MNERQIASWGLTWVSAARDTAEAALEAEVGGQAHGYLAVVALHHARTAIAGLVGVRHPAVLRVDSVAPDLKHCRDMLSHFDEYVAGKGRMQSRTSRSAKSSWLVMWSGSDQMQEVGFVTDASREQLGRTFVVNIQDALRAVAESLTVAIDESGLGPPPEWLSGVAMPED